jgi:hypothetical protein
MTKLKPQLLALRPGTRVVSHYFTLEDWEPDETIRVEDRTGYLWVVPADVRGTWTLTRADDVLRVTIEQERQKIALRGERAGFAVPVIGTRLRGTEITFTAFDADGDARQFRGRVDGGRMAGDSEVHGVKRARWSAARE